MAVEWHEIDQKIVNLAAKIIGEHLPDLLEAKVGFVFRSEAAWRNDRLVLGKAQKVSDKLRVFMDYDFLIWIAEDIWRTLEPIQREALIHHELLHCRYEDGQAKMRGHDVEEFREIIDMYGFWSHSLQAIAPAVEKALQMRLSWAAAPGEMPGFERQPQVFSVTVQEFGQLRDALAERGTDMELVTQEALEN